MPSIGWWSRDSHLALGEGKNGGRKPETMGEPCVSDFIDGPPTEKRVLLMAMCFWPFSMSGVIVEAIDARRYSKSHQSTSVKALQ